MGFLLIATVIFVLASWADLDERKYKFRSALRPFTINAIIIGVSAAAIMLIVYLDSFNSYAKARANYDRVIAQYGQAVSVYGDKAILDMRKVGDTWTDFRFQGYQDKMASFITELRDTVTAYNTLVVEKRVWAKNFFFGWYIVPADADMKLIDIVNTIPVQK